MLTEMLYLFIFKGIWRKGSRTMYTYTKISHTQVCFGSVLHKNCIIVTEKWVII